MRDLVLCVTDGARLVAVCLFWLLAAAGLARFAWEVGKDVHGRWHE